MHLMTSGQLSIKVSEARFEETSLLTYDKLVKNSKEKK